MYLTHLSLTNFRNFIRLEMGIPNGPMLLVGANAQGKTSLLEAINYLTGTSSPHTSSDRQLINFLALQEPMPFARIVAEVHRQDRLHRIEIRLILEPVGAAGEQRLRKDVSVNGIKRRVRDLAGIFNVVMFLPQDMNVIEGPPTERRRLLNSVISQADPTYADALSEYSRILSQRNALLKHLQERGDDSDELSFWDDQLCDQAAIMIRARALALNELESLAGPIHYELTREQETLRLDYMPAYDPASQPQGQLDLPIETVIDRTTKSLEAIRTGMSAALQLTREEEIARGMTIIGPHRDDFRFQVNGIDLRHYGSRGQNRTAMLSIKLSEVDWLKQRTEEHPVLLLDEVMAELDPERREDLLTRVNVAQQTILTVADMSMFSDVFCRGATILQVVAGTIAPLQP
jgi:DNA replication and repair protein RecF